MFEKLKFLNDIFIALIWCAISILGGVLIYFPEMTDGAVFSKLSDIFEFASTGTLIDALLLVLLFSYGVVCFLLAMTSLKIRAKE